MNIGFAINDPRVISELGLRHLIQLRFGEMHQEKRSGELCQLCGKEMIGDDHPLCCSIAAGIRTQRHDEIVRGLLVKFSDEKQARPVCKLLGNMQNQLRADIEYTTQAGKCCLDVAFARDQSVRAAY